MVHSSLTSTRDLLDVGAVDSRFRGNDKKGKRLAVYSSEPIVTSPLTAHAPSHFDFAQCKL